MPLKANPPPPHPTAIRSDEPEETPPSTPNGATEAWAALLPRLRALIAGLRDARGIEVPDEGPRCKMLPRITRGVEHAVGGDASWSCLRQPRRSRWRRRGGKRAFSAPGSDHGVWAVRRLPAVDEDRHSQQAARA